MHGKSRRTVNRGIQIWGLKSREVVPIVIIRGFSGFYKQFRRQSCSRNKNYANLYAPYLPYYMIGMITYYVLCT